MLLYVPQPNPVAKPATRLRGQPVHLALAAGVGQHLAARVIDVVANVYPAAAGFAGPAFKDALIGHQVGLHPSREVGIANPRHPWLPVSPW